MSEGSITELFDAALALPDGERPAYLDAACPDPATREALERLLRHAVEAPELFRRIAAGIAPPAAPERLIGQRVGAYRLERCLGQGGMGVVYLARRVDGEFEQEVALKLVKGELASEVRRALFLRERQTLARLNHPYIARLLDGGVTAAGTPYFAMELVDGEPLTAFAESRRLPVRERLALFLKVCAAVSHAHRHMVVHQDIKPGNVLVTADGTPKLLDFGVAGPLDARGAVDAPPTPAFGTPPYASPEQRRGEPASAASDVHALGAVLGELLSGRGAPPPRGDLGWICARCTDPDPARRYATVDELAADVERHLAHRPVRARPASVGYRVGRYLRRHRLGVAGAALVALVTALWVGSAVAAARETARRRDRAELERDASHRVVALLAWALGEQRDAPPDPASRGAALRQTLDRGLAQVERELVLPSDREQLAAILRSVGEVYGRLEYPRRAVVTLRHSLDVLAAAERPGPDPRTVAASWQVLGGVLLRHGCGAEAEAAIRRAIEIGEANLALADPMLVRARAELAQAVAQQRPDGGGPARPVCPREVR